MNTTALLRATTVVASVSLALSAVPAFGLVEFAGGVLNIQTTGSISYDSNIRGQANGSGDTVITISPTATFKRTEGRIAIELHGMTSAASYSDADNENHTDYSIGGSANLPFSEGSRVSGGVNFTTSKSTMVQELANDLVSTKNLSLSSSLGFQYSERLSLNSSLSWNSTKNAGLGDNRAVSVSLGASLPQILFRRLPLTVSYGHTATESQNDAGSAAKLDNSSDSFSLGTSGQLTARTTGSINVGWQTTKSDGTEATNGDTSNLNVSTNLKWQIDELLTAGLSLTRGITTSPTNDTVLNTSATLNFARQISQTLNANLTFSEGWNDFQNTGRSDKTFNASASLAYSLTRTWSASLTASHSKNKSDLGTASFDRNVFSLSFSLLL